jgi:NADP-dependent 3-hydroxy acid dehydrogenase YdfG
VAAETRDLTGSVVAVTGATAGIGAATVEQLIAAGAKVAASARREQRLAELVERHGDSVATVIGDVRDPATSRDLVRTAVERFGRLDSVVANAGVGRYGGILDGSDDDMMEMIETNLSGTVWSVRAAVAEMRRAGAGGDVVIVSSVAGLRGGADEAVYAATKFGQVGLAGALDRELREAGIRVTAICPAGVATEFAMGTGRTPDDPSLADYLTADDVAHAIVTVLQQPRRVRTTLWSLWSMGQGS